MIKIRRNRSFLTIFLFAFFAIAASFILSNSSKLKAATCTWTGNEDQFWSNGNNWDCGGLGNEDTLIFPSGASNLATENDIDPSAYTNFSDIYIQDGAYTFTGLDVDLFGVLQFEGVSQTLNWDLSINSFGGYLALKVTANDSEMIVNGSIFNGTDLYKQLAGSVTMNGTMSSSGAYTLFIQEGNFVASSADSLSGFDTIEVSNPGALYIDDTITNTVPILLDGLLYAQSGDFYMSANLTLGTNAVIDGSNGTITFDNVIDGTGPLVKSGSFILTLAGSAGNTYSGSTTIYNGDVGLQKTSGLAIPSSVITIGDTNGSDDSARMLVKASDQFNSDAAITIEQDGFLSYENPGTSNNVNDLTLNEGHAKLIGTTVLSGTFINNGGILEGADTFSISSTSFTCTDQNGSGNIIGTVTLSATDITITGPSEDGVTQCNISAAIHGDANITITGRSHVFSGSNDFTGSVTIGDNSVLEIRNANALGNSSTGTFINSGGSLALSDGITIASEPLEVGSSFTYDYRGGLTSLSGTNSYNGPISITGTDVVFITMGDSVLTLSSITGSISGNIIFNKFFPGNGSIQFSGANTFTAGRIDLLDGLVRKIASVNAFPDTQEVYMNLNARLELNSFSETLGALSGQTGAQIDLGNGTLSVGANNSNTSFSGIISGNGGVTKVGTGIFTLTADNTYTGTTNIANGKLLINGQQPSSSVSLNSTGILGGSGRVGVIVGGGTGGISPGNSPGILSVTGNVAFASTNSFNVELNGTTAGTGYDQLNVTGSVNLNNASLNVTLGFVPSTGNSFTIIQSSGVLIGTFNGLPNGSTFSVGGNTFTIEYGTNSVLLTVGTGGGSGGSGGSGGGNNLAETGITIPLMALSFLVSTTAVVVFANKYLQKRKRLHKNFR